MWCNYLIKLEDMFKYTDMLGYSDILVVVWLWKNPQLLFIIVNYAHTKFKYGK